MTDYQVKVRPEKVEQVREIRERLERSAAVLLTEYRGLTVAELAALRDALRKADVEYSVVKNTLTRLAAMEIGFDDLGDVLEGPTAVAYCYGDPVAAAKAITTFARDHQALVLKGALLDGRTIDADGAGKLATVDPREVSLAKICGALTGGIASIAGTLEAPIGRIAYVLQEYGKGSGDQAA